MIKNISKNKKLVKNLSKVKYGGFTLIELLVVVLIIGILAAVALPQYEKAVTRSRLSQAFILGNHFRNAEKLYHMANGEYADSYEKLGADLPAESRLSDPRTLVVKKFSYALASGNAENIGADRVTVSSLPGGVSLLFMFNGMTRCCSYAASNWKGTAMCEMLGAVGEPSDGGCANGGCKCWELK